jgi:protein-disulfide isomerase
VRRNPHALIAVIAAGLVGLLVTTGTAPLRAGSSAPQAKITMTEIEAAKTLGSKGAPIMIEDFSDFQCPVCRGFFLNTTKPLIDNYVSTGKVYLVHHDYPLPMHAHSEDAAKWANAAAAIGKFEEVENVLYSRQDDWGMTGKVEDTVATVLSPAELKRASALVSSPEVAAAIQHDKDLGNQRGVSATPTVYVTPKGGQTVALPPMGTDYHLLKQYLDYLLKQ